MGRLVLTIVGFLVLSGGAVFAAPSLSTSYTAGKDFRSFGIDGGFDFGAEKQFYASLGYTYTDSNQGVTTDDQSGESRSNLFALGLGWSVDDAQFWNFGLSYWRETLADIRYIGPKVAYAYTWFQGESDDKEEFLIATFGLDTFFYSAPLETDTSGRTIRRGRLASARKSTLNFAQFKPNVQVEKPFLEALLVPYVGYARYIYTQKPDQIESAISRNALYLNPAVAGAVSGVVSGFLLQTFELGMRLQLPTHTQLKFEVGESESAVNRTWFTSYAVDISQKVIQNLGVGFGWSYVAYSGAGSSFFTGGLTYSL